MIQHICTFVYLSRIHLVLWKGEPWNSKIPLSNGWKSQNPNIKTGGIPKSGVNLKITILVRSKIHLVLWKGESWNPKIPLSNGLKYPNPNFKQNEIPKSHSPSLESQIGLSGVCICIHRSTVQYQILLKLEDVAMETWPGTVREKWGKIEFRAKFGYEGPPLQPILFYFLLAGKVWSIPPQESVSTWKNPEAEPEDDELLKRRAALS